MSGQLYQPGWYPDPSGRFEFRFHNGSLWTADVSTNGQRYVDPLGASPAAQRAFPSEPSRRNGMALASMILGIVAVSIAWMPFIVAIGAICAFLALLFGVIALARGHRAASGRGGTGRGFAVAGLVTGGLAALLCIVGVVFSVAFLRAIDRYDNPAANDVSLSSCELDGATVHVVGALENLDDVEADFTVQIAFTRPGTNNPHRSARASVDDVAPGESAMFELTRQIGLDDVDCIITGVTGPLPFGLDIET